MVPEGNIFAREAVSDRAGSVLNVGQNVFIDKEQKWGGGGCGKVEVSQEKQEPDTLSDLGCAKNSEKRKKKKKKHTRKH